MKAMKCKGEILMFVLNDTERMYSPKYCIVLSIGYSMNGYLLDVKTMCKLVDIICDHLKRENIDILSESMCGQWINLITKGHSTQLLTKLQLVKNVWNKLGRITNDENKQCRPT